jgi:stress-induced morphogen
MPILQSELEKLLNDGFPDANVEVVDLAGDNDHYEVRITSPIFAGLSKLEQHKKVYHVLGNRVGSQIHALSVKTFIK